PPSGGGEGRGPGQPHRAGEGPGRCGRTVLGAWAAARASAGVLDDKLHRDPADSEEYQRRERDVIQNQVPVMFPPSYRPPGAPPTRRPPAPPVWPGRLTRVTLGPLRHTNVTHRWLPAGFWSYTPGRLPARETLTPWDEGMRVEPSAAAPHPASAADHAVPWGERRGGRGRGRIRQDCLRCGADRHLAVGSDRGRPARRWRAG